jgi:hypothetical protein
MKAFLIDSLNKQIAEIELDEKNILQEVINKIGNKVEKGLDLDNGDVVLVDEEGMDKDYITFFSIGQNFPFAGISIVIGKDYKEPLSSLDEIKSLVKFLSHEDAINLARSLVKKKRIF